MNHIKRQHYISLALLAGMLLWLGVAMARPCEMEHTARLSLEPAVRRFEALEPLERMEHHDDRYLNWDAAGKRTLPSHLAVPRSGGWSE